jgi:hypothetical protein
MASSKFLKRSPGMVRFVTLSLTALLGAATLAAQSQSQHSFGVAGMEQGQGPSQAPAPFVVPSSIIARCPVSLRALYRGGGGVMTTGKGAPGGAAQHLRLILGGILSETGSPARVTAASVTVSGTNGRWRIANASQLPRQPQHDSPHIHTTLNLQFDTESGGSEGGNSELGNLDLPGFTSVQSIRLDSLTFADGSVWTAASGGSCRVEPDPLMRVSSR